jgi:hypothetical protein
LSGNYVRQRKAIQVDHLLDVAQATFNRNSMERLADEVSRLCREGKITEAEEARQAYKPINFKVQSGTSLLHTRDRIAFMCEEKKESLIEWHGANARFFGDELEKDSFIVVMAVNKFGKSTHLLDFAWRAMEQRVRVAYFQVGDLSERQLLRRFATRACKRPLKPKKVIVPEKLWWIGEGRDKILKVKREIIEYKNELTEAKIWESFERVRLKIASKNPYLVYKVFPSYSVSVVDLENTLKEWERNDGFVPQIIVCDYADILAPINTKRDSRDQINETWLTMRQISQKRSCCFLTATQAKATAFTNGPYLLSRKDFSDDRRKLDHPTGIIGINPTPQTVASKAEIFRLNWINRRDDSSDGILHIAGCKAIGNPITCSIM